MRCWMTQLRSDTPGEHDARFVRAVSGVEDRRVAGTRMQALLERIGAEVHPVGKVLKTRMEIAGAEAAGDARTGAGCGRDAVGCEPCSGALDALGR